MHETNNFRVIRQWLVLFENNTLITFSIHKRTKTKTPLHLNNCIIELIKVRSWTGPYRTVPYRLDIEHDKHKRTIRRKSKINTNITIRQARSSELVLKNVKGKDLYVFHKTNIRSDRNYVYNFHLPTCFLWIETFNGFYIVT